MAVRSIVVMGPSGSGKSTIGSLLATRLEADFIDADDHHPEANREKMVGNVPLDDEDRMPWLHLVGKAMQTETQLERSVVVACSALKRVYRDVLREYEPDATFVYLHGSPDLLAGRLGARTGHFMPKTLLDSQLAALEPLGADESGVVVDIDASPDSIVDAAVTALENIG